MKKIVLFMALIVSTTAFADLPGRYRIASDSPEIKVHGDYTYPCSEELEINFVQDSKEKIAEINGKIYEPNKGSENDPSGGLGKVYHRVTYKVKVTDNSVISTETRNYMGYGTLWIPTVFQVGEEYKLSKNDMVLTLTTYTKIDGIGKKYRCTYERIASF